MERSIERVPTWALPYMVNGDTTGLKDKEIKMIDNLLRKRCIELVCPIADSVQGGTPPYYTNDPLFGKATEVEDCIVFTISKLKGYECYI